MFLHSREKTNSQDNPSVTAAQIAKARRGIVPLYETPEKVDHFYLNDSLMSITPV
jgi:hypothetical protein